MRRLLILSLVILIISVITMPIMAENVTTNENDQPTYIPRGDGGSTLDIPVYRTCGDPGDGAEPPVPN